ncbi:hypothetical protein [Butyrivibrio sp. JL13D10]|uniref:hypothetical protein n=1 Tax=Butyrivibrio sp. JL13D10 TaxID=3236815 RepID=UPI0038B544F0
MSFIFGSNQEGIDKKQMRRITAILMGIMISSCIIGCGADSVAEKTTTGVESTISSKVESWKPEDGYIAKSERIDSAAFLEEANTEFELSVPTYVTKLDGNWFIVDCYHDRIIYNDNLESPINEWKVLTTDVRQPHTMAGDGTVILVDDTENNRVLVFERQEGSYVNTQLFNNIGNRPHYTVYDENAGAFYVWSSTTGEMYVFRHEEAASEVYLTEIRKVHDDENSLLDGTYVRSFYLDEDEIYFVSGIRSDGMASGIIICDKDTLKIKEKIDVPDSLAGMVALYRDGEYFYITVSTDISGNQDAATMIRTKNLKGLINGDYEDIYSKYFIGGGTPYNVTKIDDIYYLTEHRLPGHSVWSYRIENDEIVDVKAVY